MYMILRPFLSIYPVLDRVILMHLLDTEWVAYNLFIIIVEARESDLRFSSYNFQRGGGLSGDLRWSPFFIQLSVKSDGISDGVEDYPYVGCRRLLYMYV